MSEHLCDFPRVSQPEGACPYCRIAELEKQLKKYERLLRDANTYGTDNAWWQEVKGLLEERGE